MNQQEKDRAASYNQMFQLSAWKEFQLFLDNERSTALEQAIDSEDIKAIQLNRGKVKQIDSIKAHLGYVTSEH